MKPNPQAPDPKSLLRKTALKRRDSIPLPVRRLKDAAVAERLLSLDEFMAAKNVLLFASFRSEVNTDVIIRASLEAGKTVLLPRTNPQSRTISVFAIRSIDELLEGYMGIPEPPDTDPRDPGDAGLILMPGAAFDLRGGRIGYGMGCYDKLLDTLEGRPILIAPAFEEQLVEEVPMDQHDVSVDIIVTDKRIIRR